MSQVFPIVVSLIATFTAMGKLKDAYYNQLYDVELFEEYDFIVVGSGSAGSIVASRLSEHPNVTLLMLEAGDSGRGDVRIKTPFFQEEIFGTSKDWNYSAEISIYGYLKKTINYIRGKVGGGTSSVNSLHFYRGSKKDYDSWENLGAEGWGYDDVLPFFKKIEKSMDSSFPANVGKYGKIPISREYSPPKMHDFVRNLANELNIPFLDYLSNENICEGFSNSTVTVAEGVRQTSATAYLWPEWKKRKSRLHFAFNAIVHKILLRDNGIQKKAYGVRFEHKGKLKEVTAKKEIILSAGAINSAQLLMLSGIGPIRHLQEMKIQTEVHLPGVGSNLNDHVGVVSQYRGTNMPRGMTTNTLQAILSFPDYISSGEGPLSSSDQTPVVAHFNTVKPNLKENTGTNKVCGSPNVRIYFCARPLPEKFRNNKNEEQFLISLSLMKPQTQGMVRLSSNNPKDSPKIDFTFLQNPEDWKTLIEGFRIIEQFEQTNLFRDMNIKLIESEGSSNKIPRSEEFYTRKIVNEIEPFLRGSSTCKIGKSTDSEAVVDPRLRVYGVSGLRVADASVMPHLVSVLPQGTVFVIAEKASHMILEDWGLSV